MVGAIAKSAAACPDGWRLVRLGDVANVAFSSVDKKTADGEVPVELCNYTDVFYNRRIRAGMKLMTATATPAERDTWSLKKGDVLFTKDSETPDEIGVPSYVSDDMPNVLCGYHLGLARPSSDLVYGAFLARALASRASVQEFSRIANGVTRFGLTLEATRNLSILLPPLPEPAGRRRRAGLHRRGHRANKGRHRRHGAPARRPAPRAADSRRPRLA